MRPTGLWRHPNFVRLWAAATISTFGSLITRTALPFTAILVLDASALDLGFIRVAELLPGPPPQHHRRAIDHADAGQRS